MKPQMPSARKGASVINLSEQPLKNSNINPIIAGIITITVDQEQAIAYENERDRERLKYTDVTKVIGWQ